jgi:hypothetical protein
MGSGRLEEDQYTHMVVASFLQKNTQYVSLLTGGYQSIHDYFGEHMADCLEDHNTLKCSVCNFDESFSGNELKNTGNNNKVENYSKKTVNQKPSHRQSIDLFGKLSAAMKSKTNEVKDKLFDYIVNPSATPSTATGSQVTERHVLSNEKNGKRYRNVAPVFSIDDDNEERVANNDTEKNNDTHFKEVVSLQLFLKSPDIVNSFQCQEVHMNGFMYDSHLIVTKTHLIVLRDLGQNDKAQIIVRRLLSSIVKITAKKRHRDLITFKYGVNGETLLITDMDRFLIPNASEATAIVLKHIVSQLENNKQFK